jgi:polyhydroxybutyrate depolymerase
MLRRARARFALIVVLALLATLGVAGSAPNPVAASGCTLSGTGTTVTRTVAGRSYALHVPSTLTGTSVPLLVDLHGDYEPVTYEESLSGWSTFADAHNFIVAYPVGTGVYASWDWGQGSADVAFIRGVVADISATYCIDPHHVHAAGISNGGGMTSRLACDAADLFASVDIHAGVDATIPSPTQWFGSACTPSRPIAVAITFGVFDPASSYAVNLQMRGQWLTRLGCPTTGTSESGVLVEAIHYTPCSAGVEVLWRVYPQTHNWPINQPFAADANDLHARVWDLFTRNPLP